MADTRFFKKNLEALKNSSPALVSALKKAPPLPALQILPARSGEPVPVINRGGRPCYLHSRFNPESEGLRTAGAAKGGFTVVFGLGGAYHIRPLLRRTELTGLLIVDENISFLRSILEGMDFSDIFSDPRVHVLVDASPMEIRRFLLQTYIPVLYGNMETLVLRSRRDLNPQWFTRAYEALKDLPEVLGRDYTTQKRFGKRWFMNTLANLARSEKCAVPPDIFLRPHRRVLVTAAGPSLEEQLPKIRKLQSEGALLLAADTSLPVLLASQITPDWVLSIDCQTVSYHHFLKGLPPETVLFLDLASPPVLTRQTDKVLFFSAGHPLSIYLQRYYRFFPELKIPGGTVTNAALSLARMAGAETVHLFGADFSYPLGRPYARGTYLYPYFQSRSKRTGSSENAFWHFVESARPRRELEGGICRLRTAVLDSYREALEESAAEFNFELTAEKGMGLPLRLPPLSAKRVFPAAQTVLAAPGAVKKEWAAAVDEYRRLLEELPAAGGTVGEYTAGLNARQRQAWATLLPIAASFREDTSGSGFSAVEKSRQWVIKVLAKKIDQDIHHIPDI